MLLNGTNTLAGRDKFSALTLTSFAQRPDRFFTSGDLMPVGAYYYPEHWNREHWGRDILKKAELGFLTGYIWDAEEYPWLHIWHGIRDGQVWAKGLEFGTTGLGDNLAPEVRAVNTFFGRNHNLFIDAQSSVTKSYLCFLMKIPADFLEVPGISVYEDGFTVIISTVSGQITSSFQFISVLIQ